VTARAPAAEPPAGPGPARPGWMAAIPPWLLTILFALGFVILGLAGYWVYRSLRTQPQPAPAPKIALEAPTLPSPEAVKAHPIARHIEITGLRLTEDSRQRASIQFVVVNHSAAEIGDLAANVNLIAVTVNREKEPVGTFSFKVASLGPYESRDLKAPLSTRLRVYELPDWQFLRADLQITSP